MGDEQTTGPGTTTTTPAAPGATAAPNASSTAAASGTTSSTAAPASSAPAAHPLDAVLKEFNMTPDQLIAALKAPAATAPKTEAAKPPANDGPLTRADLQSTLDARDAQQNFNTAMSQHTNAVATQTESFTNEVNKALEGVPDFLKGPLLNDALTQYDNLRKTSHYPAGHPLSGRAYGIPDATKVADLVKAAGEMKNKLTANALATIGNGANAGRPTAPVAGNAGGQGAPQTARRTTLEEHIRGKVNELMPTG